MKTESVLVMALVGLIGVGIVVNAINLGGNTPQGQDIVNNIMTERKIITVSGLGELEAKSDLAEVYLGIRTTADTADDAEDDNKDIYDDVTGKLLSNGIYEKDIEVESYTVEKSGTQWTAEKLLKITTARVNDVASLLDYAKDKGANIFDRVEFTLSDSEAEEAQADALKQAAEKTDKKAKAIASGLKVTLKEVASATEVEFDIDEFVVEITSVDEDMKIFPQSITVSATVSVAYEIQ